MTKCLFIYGGELGQIIESTAEERRVTAGRTAGVTGPGAGATRRERHQSRRWGRGVQELKRRQKG